MDKLRNHLSENEIYVFWIVLPVIIFIILNIIHIKRKKIFGHGLSIFIGCYEAILFYLFAFVISVGWVLLINEVGINADDCGLIIYKYSRLLILSVALGFVTYPITEIKHLSDNSFATSLASRIFYVYVFLFGIVMWIAFVKYNIFIIRGLYIWELCIMVSIYLTLLYAGLADLLDKPRLPRIREFIIEPSKRKEYNQIFINNIKNIFSIKYVK